MNEFNFQPLSFGMLQQDHQYNQQNLTNRIDKLGDSFRKIGSAWDGWQEVKKKAEEAKQAQARLDNFKNSVRGFDFKKYGPAAEVAFNGVMNSGDEQSAWNWSQSLQNIVNNRELLEIQRRQEELEKAKAAEEKENMELYSQSAAQQALTLPKTRGVASSNFMFDVSKDRNRIDRYKNGVDFDSAKNTNSRITDRISFLNKRKELSTLSNDELKLIAMDEGSLDNVTKVAAIQELRFRETHREPSYIHIDKELNDLNNDGRHIDADDFMSDENKDDSRRRFYESQGWHTYPYSVEERSRFADNDAKRVDNMMRSLGWNERNMNNPNYKGVFDETPFSSAHILEGYNEGNGFVPTLEKWDEQLSYLPQTPYVKDVRSRIDRMLSNAYRKMNKQRKFNSSLG